MQQQIQVHLHVLPSEILEYILVFCTVENCPQTVSALAQTCTHLRTLVYNAPDHHLWRALFLAAFDDPRHTVEQHAIESDWRREFETRIWAGRFVSLHANEVSVQQLEEYTGTSSDNTSFSFAGESGQTLLESRAIQALIRMARTARPAASYYEQGHVQLSGEQLASPLSELHPETPLTPPPIPSQISSRTIKWLQRSLTNNLPVTAFTYLFFVRFSERLWRRVPEGQQLCEFIACIGYVPPRIVENPASESPHTDSRISPPLSSNVGPSTPIPANSISGVGLPDVAKRAQKIAFNMRYLSPHRHWGPYVHHSPPSSIVGEEEIENTETDSVPPDSEDSGSSRAATPDLWQPPPPGSHGTLLPEQLHPDWVWLAAARIIAQNILRTHIGADECAELERWDNLREGAWLSPRLPDLPDAHIERSTSEAMEESWKKHQWDWAGAEGMWRRLTCWLGYDSLVHWNSQSPDVQQWDGEGDWAIVPMSLRITGYSAPSLAAYPDRPTIHVKGEMGGPSWLGNGLEFDDENIRYVHGTVSMLPDGRVRWSITSTFVNEEEEDEWASEAIQLGGVGSTMGALGMKTGATHLDNDPLNVIWQWRVR